MKLNISGGMRGTIQAQPSKSMAHRAVICGALAEGTSRIENIAFSEDILATIRCVEALGLAEVTRGEASLTIRGKGKQRREAVLLDCGESGSTLRFLIPLAACLAERVRLSGKGRLMERPLEPLKSLLAQRGLTWQGNDRFTGTIQAGEYPIRGDVSSQFISGLLFALPLLEGDSKIILTTALESAGYVELTRRSQERFGVTSRWEDGTLYIEGNQCYQPADYEVEGDFSHAAFFAVAGAIGEGVTITGLDMDSPHGDKAVFSILEQMGATVEIQGNRVSVKGGQLSGCVIDGSQIPDLVPVLAVAGAYAKGETRIVNAGRLRIKESDRLAAMAEELGRLGARIQETKDGLMIQGGRPLRGAAVSSHNDHRIAMSLAVAAGFATGALELEGAECVKKSAPQFWEEFRALGGSAQ